MEKKVLFQRMKGLLALVLAFTMMFGTGMMVLADEAKIAFEEAIKEIVEIFYYRDLDEDVIVKGVIHNKEKLIEVLTK